MGGLKKGRKESSVRVGHCVGYHWRLLGFKPTRILEEFCRIFFRMVLLKDNREEPLSSQLSDVAESKD